MIRGIKNRSGFTILEAVIGLSIGSIVIVSAYKANNYFTKGAMRENSKSIIQQEIITAGGLLAKDIRMAGLSLPGNGIRVTLSDVSNDQIKIFVNQSQNKTNLTKIMQYSDSIAIIASADGFSSNGWACIAENSVDTLYREINRIGINTTGPDTLYLSSRLQTGPFSTSSLVYPADQIKYYTDSVKGGLYRVMNKTTVCLAPHLDILSITPKNAAGTALVSNGNDADLLSISIGKKLPSGNSFSIISDSTEINIRNRG